MKPIFYVDDVAYMTSAVTLVKKETTAITGQRQLIIRFINGEELRVFDSENYYQEILEMFWPDTPET